jgi:hypothetical protein
MRNVGTQQPRHPEQHLDAESIMMREVVRFLLAYYDEKCSLHETGRTQLCADHDIQSSSMPPEQQKT